MNDWTTVVARTREIWRQALETCEENIQKWKQHEQEYTELKNRLAMFPTRLSHQVMVPFGKVALMPGRLIHTNEVMVLLGDNWFAMRSAHQAQEIVDRRLKYVAETIKKYEEERQVYVDRLEGMKRLIEEDSMANYIEIREPVEEDRGKQKVRKAHQPSSKRQNPSRNKVAFSGLSPDAKDSPKKVQEVDFSTLMEHLDVLGREEEVDEKSMDGKENDHHLPSSESLVTGQNGTALMSKSATVTPSTASSTSMASSSSMASSTVKEKMSTVKEKRITWREDVNETEKEVHAAIATIPAKSILKNRDEAPRVAELPPSPYEPRPKVVSSVTEEAFRSTVQERSFDIPSSSASTTDRPRPMSKFAQERAALKRQ